MTVQPLCILIVVGAVAPVPQRQSGSHPLGQHLQFFIGSRHRRRCVESPFFDDFRFEIPHALLDGFQHRFYHVWIPRETCRDTSTVGACSCLPVNIPEAVGRFKQTLCGSKKTAFARGRAGQGALTSRQQLAQRGDALLANRPVSAALASGAPYGDHVDEVQGQVCDYVEVETAGDHGASPRRVD
jgi:hypothetical protein